MNKEEKYILDSIEKLLPIIKSSICDDTKWIDNFATEYLNNMKAFIKFKNGKSKVKALQAIGGVAKTVGDSWSWGETKVGNQFWKIVNCFEELYIKDRD